MVETQLFEEVDLFISCRNLKNIDIVSKTDPVCYVSEIEKQTQSLVPVGETEKLKDTLDPDFKALRMKFYFEKS